MRGPTFRHALALLLGGAMLNISWPGSAAETKAVRPPALAGTWYPESPSILLATAHGLMRQAVPAARPSGKPVALLVPHAGWVYSGAAAASAFRLLSHGAFRRVVVLAPSHYGGFSGYALDDVERYRTPVGEIPLSKEGLATLKQDGLARVVPGVTGPEHAVEIELPFLQAALGSFELVPVLVGRTDAASERAFAERLAGLDDGGTLFVISSDFTHYGPRFDYAPFGPTSGATKKIRELDATAIGLIARGDAPGFRAFLHEKGATICGRNGIGTLLELLQRIAPKGGATLLAHWASGEMPEVRDDSSVDYVAMAFTREAGGTGAPLTAPPVPRAVPVDAPRLPEELGRALVRVARGTLELDLAGRSETLSAALRSLESRTEASRLQAVFVTLKLTDPREIARVGELRGCIGQVVPTHPLDLAVVTSALDAAVHDPRFPPVQARELKALSVEVTVLSPIRPVGSWKEIRIGEHGIVLEKGGRRALFLPQVAVEQKWTLEETLEHLSAKAGLGRGEWRSGASFSVFTGQVFHEDGVH